MNRRLVWLIAFIFLTFAGDRLGGWLLQNVVADSQFRYSRLYEGTAEADILLLGNSRGLGFYQPFIEEQTGKMTFNLSYNGLPVDAANMLVQDYLEQYPPPEILVVDITICDRQNAQLLSGFNQYAPYSPRLQNLLQDQVPKSYYGGQVSHLYRYNSEIFQRTLFYYQKPDTDWLIDRSITPELIDSVQTTNLYEIDLHPYLLKNLTELVTSTQQAGVEVRLVISPYFLPYAKRLQNLEALKKAVEQLTGLPVWDYSEALEGAAYFGDYQHINKQGSRAFIQLMRVDGVLP